MFDRLSILHQSRRLYLVFTGLILVNILIFVFPIFLFIGDRDLSAISFLDLSYFWLFIVLFLTIFVFGSRQYLIGNKKRSKYWFDVLLIIMISKLLGILYRYWNLLVFFNNNPFDRVSVIFGPYVFILTALIIITGIIRYNYSGIERRNSIFYY
jgi:hypothetical protein